MTRGGAPHRLFDLLVAPATRPLPPDPHLPPRYRRRACGARARAARPARRGPPPSRGSSVAVRSRTARPGRVRGPTRPPWRQPHRARRGLRRARGQPCYRHRRDERRRSPAATWRGPVSLAAGVSRPLRRSSATPGFGPTTGASGSTRGKGSNVKRSSSTLIACGSGLLISVLASSSGKSSTRPPSSRAMGHRGTRPTWTTYKPVLPH